MAVTRSNLVVPSVAEATTRGGMDAFDVLDEVLGLVPDDLTTPAWIATGRVVVALSHVALTEGGKADRGKGGGGGRQDCQRGDGQVGGGELWGVLER